MSTPLAVLAQYALPKKALTRCAGWLADQRAGAATTWVIRRFIERYGVNMAEAAQPDPAAYPSFNEFFTRPLRAGARPLAPFDFVSPVDGAVSQLGPIRRQTIVQAKEHDYSTLSLVGGDAQLAAEYDDGWFATLYLSPKDYHRIHAPCAGQLRRMIYIPGDLFSVNPLTARHVPGLFARNERVVCVFDAPWGSWTIVLVGATIVGSMATAWHGRVQPQPAQITDITYEPGAFSVAQGDEIGRFLLGSTIVLLLPKMALHWNASWQPSTSIRMGEAMASCQQWV